VIALSGAYDLTVFESQSSVFGKDPEVRREASPFHFIRPGRPPFFVSYCQWDYPTLPAQAKSFWRGLRRAGLEAELFYTPRENHISEMIAMTYDDDPTTQAALRFMRRLVR
jgi:dipeptidyl aminopeptidase/acylaminoacyl peptidase